jgi:PAS domain S-box-containing protein
MILKRLHSLNNWHFIWIAVAISEIFTALMNTVNSYFWYGNLRADLLWIGSIDALFVSFFVSLIVIYFLRNTRKLEEFNRLLSEQMAEKNRMASALKENEIRYRTLFEKAGDAIFILEAEDPEIGKIVDANRAAAEMHGYTVLELLGRHIRELDSPQAAAEIQGRMSRLLKGEWLQREVLHRHRDGTLFPVEINAGLLEIDGHKYILAIDRDISLRKEAEKALRESENKYRAIFDNAQEGIWVVDREGRTTLVNHQMAAMLGCSESDLLGRAVEEFVWDFDRSRFGNRLPARESGKPSQYELTFHHRNDSPIYAIVNTAPVLDSEGRVCGAFGMVTDISARKKMEEALRESEERYRKIVEAAPYPISITRLEDGQYLQANNSFYRLTGYTPGEILGKTPFELNFYVDPKDLTRFLAIIREKGEVEAFELQFRTKEGRIFDVLLAARPIQLGGIDCLLAVFRDVSQEKLAQKEKEELTTLLRQAQKMEAIGTLAGGIAHDFNNILTAILGYTELALMDVRRETPLYRDLSRVIEASQRAKELVGQILAFTRKEKAELKPLSIGPLVKEAVKLIRAIIPSSIEIQLDLDKETGMVVAEPVQIHQVIINLCANGAQAMQSGGGILKIGLSRVRLTEPQKAIYTQLSPGYYVLLSVADNGIGMGGDLMERIFDPYFTTKEKGQGTGLGLSTVLGILQSHGGAITVESHPGRGSLFKVYLPVAKNLPGPAHEGIQTSPPSGRERILLIDDEEPLTALGKKMLEKLGYRVTVKKNGPEALRDFQESPRIFDLVITDQTMPLMLGTSLIQELRQIRPDVPIILCTGYSELDFQELGRDLGIQGYIKKPYKMMELAQTIRKAVLHS